MDSELDVDPEYAIGLVKEYLAGNWLESTQETVSLKVISGGNCSRLYLCKDLTKTCVPSQLLIRLTGGKILDDDDPIKGYNEGTESIVFFMHGHLGYGPKLYGIFEGGRLEEYIPSRPLENEDLLTRSIRLQFARKLARFHSMKLPVSKKPHPSLDVLTSTHKLYDTPEGHEEMILKSKLTGHDPNWVKMLNFPEEIEWIRNTLQKVGGRLVLSTNDMNRLNCLIRDEPDQFGEVVTLVDYEIGGTNWRGYDIGTHFAFWMLDVRSPDFKSGLSYPDIEIRKEFINEYLRQTKAMDVYDNFDAEGLDSCEHVLMEAELMIFFWILLWMFHELKPKFDPDMDPHAAKHRHSFSRAIVSFYVEHKKYYLETYSKILNATTRPVCRDLEILNST